MDKVTCPVCNGTKQILTSEWFRKYFPNITKESCKNCGGQKMLGVATGMVYTRSDGSACIHDYDVKIYGLTYSVYECKFCPDHFDVDSGD